MTTFKYRAKDANGKPVRGVVTAQDEFAAVQKIRQSAPVIMEIEPVKVAGGEGGLLSMEIGGKPKIKSDELSLMCSQFSIMLRSGIQIARCIELVGGQTENKALKKILLSIGEDVADGSGVASSFEREGQGLFPTTFIETIRAGEMAGTLELAFAKLEKYFDKSSKNSKKLKSAMGYPIFVMVIAVIVVAVVMIKVVPTLTSAFIDLGGEMPLITQILIDTSEFFTKYWMVMAIVILVAVIGSKLYFGTEKGRLVKGKILLNMPVIGKISVLSGAAQFASTMAVMLESGLTVNHATDVTAKVMDNAVMQADVAGMSGRLEEGHPLGECIKNCAYFPENLRQMTSIGEETGELADTLDVVGDYYTNEADRATASAIAKLEPAMLVFLSAFAGYIVIAIYLPMFTMYGLF